MSLLSSAPAPTQSFNPGGSDLGISFDPISSLTTCDTTNVRWSYAGPENSMLLFVDGPAVDNDSPVNILLSGSNVDPTSLSFEWVVNVPEGSYHFMAEIADLLTLSSVFDVTNGTDTSCLSSSSPVLPILPGSPSGPTPTTSALSLLPIISVLSSYMSDPSSLRTSESALQSLPSPTVTGASGTLDPSPAHAVTNAGVIVGGVAGALALLIAMTCTLSFFRRRRRPRDEESETISPAEASSETKNITSFIVLPDVGNLSRSRNDAEHRMSSVSLPQSGQNIMPPIATPLRPFSTQNAPSTHTSRSESLRPQDSASQVEWQEGREMPSSSVSDIHLEMRPMSPSPSPPLDAPIQHADSGRRFKKMTPSDLSALGVSPTPLDVPPIYTRE